MKKLMQVFIIFVFVLKFFSFDSSNTEAASTKTAFVNVEKGSTLNVRSGTSNKAKKIGSLKDGASVVVYSQTKSGWSEIRYKNKKAFVTTKYLKFANSYLMDKTKVYTYKTDGEIFKHIYVKNNQGYDEWIVNGKNRYVTYEDKDGLYTGYIESEGWTDLQYPIKIGVSWDIGLEGEGTAKVTSVSKTIKTPAGTFKNCIETKHSNGYITYYAKNVGFVKSIYKGKTGTELISLKKR